MPTPSAQQLSDVLGLWESYGTFCPELAQRSFKLTNLTLRKNQLTLALNTFRMMSINAKVAVEMWNDRRCRDVLLRACRLTDPDDHVIRKYLWTSLINIANSDSKVAGAMWKHVSCHRLVRNGCTEGPMSYPESTLKLLKELLNSKLVCTEFWADAELRNAVITFAATSGEGTADRSIRANSLGCLGRMAKFSPDVWWDSDSRRAILNACTALSRKVSETATLALARIATQFPDVPIWDNRDSRRCLIEAANHEGWSLPSTPAHCLWALYSLAEDLRISTEMVLEEGVLECVANSCRSEDLRNQEAALCLLSRFAESITNSSIVWATTAGILSPMPDCDFPHFIHVLRTLAFLAQDPIVAADMVTKFPTIRNLTDEAAARTGLEHTELRELAVALRSKLPQPNTVVAGPDLPLAEIPSDLVSGKLRPEQRVLVIQDWVSKLEAVITSNQGIVDDEVKDITTQYHQRLKVAFVSHRNRVVESMDSFKHCHDEATEIKESRMLKIKKSSTKLDVQRAELAEARESLKEAQAMLVLFKESRSQSKRKATAAPTPATPTTKRSRSGALTPPDSAAGPATRERPAYHFCPITHEVMVDPVVTADGESYERSAITEWLSKSNLSPMHGSELSSTVLFNNQALKHQIAEWVE